MAGDLIVLHRNLWIKYVFFYLSHFLKFHMNRFWWKYAGISKTIRPWTAKVEETTEIAKVVPSFTPWTCNVPFPYRESTWTYPPWTEKNPKNGMVGIRSFPSGAYFQGRTVSFREYTWNGSGACNPIDIASTQVLKTISILAFGTGY